MPSLTIGGQEREVRLSATELTKAERQILKLGGQKIMVTLTRKDESGAWFALDELALFLGAAWGEPGAALLAQFYREGGTVFEVQGVVVDAIIDSGLFGRRPSANGAGPPADPPGAGTSGS